MPRQSPYQIVLSPDERRTLTARAAKYTRPYFEVIRAKMILLAAEGWSNDAIARSLRTRREVVSLWRKRFFEQRLAGLEDQVRSGRPRAFPPSGRRHRQSARL
jgi:Winged helix-turn helix